MDIQTSESMIDKYHQVTPSTYKNCVKLAGSGVVAEAILPEDEYYQAVREDGMTFEKKDGWNWYPVEKFVGVRLDQYLDSTEANLINTLAILAETIRQEMFIFENYGRILGDRDSTHIFILQSRQNPNEIDIRNIKQTGLEGLFSKKTPEVEGRINVLSSLMFTIQEIVEGQTYNLKITKAEYQTLRSVFGDFMDMNFDAFSARKSDEELLKPYSFEYFLKLFQTAGTALLEM